jgi:cytochrome c oxidase accessory protein FixG
VSLVAARKWVYPAESSGRFRQARRGVGIALIAFFVLTPWITVGGLPAARLDLPGRRLLLLGAVFTPHDTWALALLLLLSALSIFFFTSVLGRVWCGWACPQTVWLEWVYRPIERLVEGPAHRQKRRDEGPKDVAWWRVKLTKWVAYLLVSLVATGVFLSWFVGGPELLRGGLGKEALFVGGLLGTLFFLDAAWFREQFCVYACPYARFQGALMDRHSLVVAYDKWRGEPRRAHKKPEGGDCIDCGRCVQVCPSGIDIREGDQLSCIACAACADACDQVMIKIGKPQGLVRYTADRDHEGVPRAEGHLFSRRSTVYLGLLGVVASVLVAGLLTRDPIEVATLRSRGEDVFRELPDGRVVNHFAVHVTNASAKAHRFTIEAVDAEGVELTVPGMPWEIPWGDERRIQAFIAVEKARLHGGRVKVRLRVRRDDGPEVMDEVTIVGPST